jgi:hypothetical protein
MGNLRAHKCKNKACRKAYQPTRDTQLYCSAKCRQAAYRRRKQRGIGKTSQVLEKPLLVAFCEHCSGSFWAQRGRARFCSTSCRTLYHRALKDAIPQAIMALYGLPEEKAIDIMETQPIGKVRELLQAAGYTYYHVCRKWQIDSQL